MKFLRIGLILPNGVDKKQSIAWQSACALPKIDDIEIDIVIIHGASVEHGRNACVSLNNVVVESAFAFDYILFVDSDIKFTWEHIQKLLSHNVPIVSGLYQHRLERSRSSAAFYNDLCEEISWVPWVAPEGLMEVDHVGAGFLLVHSDVFCKMQKPYFEIQTVRVGNRVNRTCECGGFCLNAKSVGYQILVDRGCKVTHVTAALVVRICLCFPNEALIPYSPAYRSAKRLKNTAETHYEIITVQEGTDLFKKRNHCITSASPTTALPDYYLMVDGDIEFTAKNIEQLLNCDELIVSGVYCKDERGDMYSPAYWKDVPGNIGGFYPSDTTGVIEVDYAPGGFLLVSKKAIERLTYPYFRPTMIEYAGKQEMSSGDVGFCLQAANADIPIYANFSCIVHHKSNYMNCGGNMPGGQMSILEIELAISRAMKHAHESIINLENIATNLLKVLREYQVKEKEEEGDGK